MKKSSPEKIALSERKSLFEISDPLALFAYIFSQGITSFSPHEDTHIQKLFREYYKAVLEKNIDGSPEEVLLRTFRETHISPTENTQFNMIFVVLRDQYYHTAEEYIRAILLLDDDKSLASFTNTNHWEIASIFSSSIIRLDPSLYHLEEIEVRIKKCTHLEIFKEAFLQSLHVEKDQNKEHKRMKKLLTPDNIFNLIGD